MAANESPEQASDDAPSANGSGTGAPDAATRWADRWGAGSWSDDSWHDAPADQEGDDALRELGDLDDRFLQSLRTPSYDLGPQTESVVVDLTEPARAQARHAVEGGSPATGAEAPAEPPAVTPPPFDLPTLADPAPAPVASTPSMPTEPAATTTPTAAPEPTPAAPAPTPAAPAPAPTPDQRAVDSPRERFHIPPAPTGSALSGAESLTAATVLRSRRPKPQSGWRRGVFSMTGGKVNLGLSRADRRRADLKTRARTPIDGCHRLAIISLKGGVGKTTTTAALGQMFAELRGDRVIAVDANPDRGTLGERVVRESGATVRHLLAQRDQLHRYADVRAFTSQAPSRLEILASDSDPHVSAAFSEQDYRDTIDILERFYNLVLTDCGTGLLHDAMHGVLGVASSLVVVSSASLDGARSASATLDWLEAHGFDHLARNAVVVISSVRPGGGQVDLKQLEGHFASRCRDVLTIPYDPHLEAGGALDLGELRPETRDAYGRLAASVGEGFAAKRGAKR